MTVTWNPGDECPRCLGHGQIDYKIETFQGPTDEGYDIKVCPVCNGVGSLKPKPTIKNAHKRMLAHAEVHLQFARRLKHKHLIRKMAARIEELRVLICEA